MDCPVCDSYDIDILSEIQNPDGDTIDITYKCRCKECGTYFRYIEVYKLSEWDYLPYD